MPIDEYPLRDSVNTGIAYSKHYEGVRAAVWAGATLGELNRWMDGGYSREFMAAVVAAYRADGLIAMHRDDAVARAARRRRG